MSQTFSLVCHETKQALWIGQGHGGALEVLYSGEPKTMLQLRAFLQATRGKPLFLQCDDTEATESYQELDSMSPEDIEKTGPAVD